MNPPTTNREDEIKMQANESAHRPPNESASTSMKPFSSQLPNQPKANPNQPQPTLSKFGLLKNCKKPN
jgi:hypothetical protein